MLKFLKAWAIWLSILVYGAPQVAPVLVHEAQAAATIEAPALAALPAIAGATAIVAALSEDAWSVTIHALNWDKDNAAVNSDIRLEWSGALMIPRTEHTVIWQYNPHQQAGYYAVAWTSGTGSYDGGYAFGCHPFPATNCTTDGADGNASTGDAASSAHCWEIAGAGHALDYLVSTANAGATGTTVVKNVWYTQVRRVHLATYGPCNGQYQHDYYFDYSRDTTKVIHHCTPTGELTAPSGTARFYFGGSLWQANSPSSGKNDETLAGKLRCVEQYDAALSDADVATEAATCTNSASSTAGIAHLWYANADPIPSDVTDKSGAGHDPSWATANRPTQWDSTYVGSFAGKGQLMGVGRP